MADNFDDYENENKPDRKLYLLKLLCFLLVVLLAFWAVSTLPNKAWSHDFSTPYNQMLKPTVRIKDGFGNAGSGTVVNVAGGYSWVVTNFHVVRNNLSLARVPYHPGVVVVRNRRPSVGFFDHTSDVIFEKSEEAFICAWDFRRDLALLKVPYVAKYVARMGHSKYLRIFEPVWAMGSPTGTIPMPTEGIVSSIHYYVDWRNTGNRFLGFTAPIVDGNSGGGLYRKWRKEYLLVGVVSRLLDYSVATGDGFTSFPLYFMGLAIPSEDVIGFVEKNIKCGF